MADPDRDTVYGSDRNRTIYTRESNSTGWFVGIIVALALLAIAYLVFSANSQPSSTTVNNTPAVTTPAAPGGDTTTNNTTTPMAPADNGTTTTTLQTPATTAPADNGVSAAPSAPAANSAAAPASSAAPAPASSAAAQ